VYDAKDHFFWEVAIILMTWNIKQYAPYHAISVSAASQIGEFLAKS